MATPDSCQSPEQPPGLANGLGMGLGDRHHPETSEQTMSSPPSFWGGLFLSLLTEGKQSHRKLNFPTGPWERDGSVDPQDLWLWAMGTVLPGLARAVSVLWLGAAVAHSQQIELKVVVTADGSGLLKAHAPGHYQKPGGAENNS